MLDKIELKNIIEISNKKSLEWNMAQNKIEEILKRLSDSNNECSQFDHLKDELRNEIRKMWSDLETYKIELEMQNDELVRAFRDAEDIKNDYIELFNSSPSGYIILNSSAIILNANQTFANMVKEELIDIYQKPFQNFIDKKDVSNFLSRFKSYFKNPSDKFFELILIDSRNSPITVRLESVKKEISIFTSKKQFLVHNALDKQLLNREHELLFISLSDITELKKVEEEKENLKDMLLQARKMEAIGTLSSGIAHDFNNILFPILGFGEILRDELSDQTIDKYKFSFSNPPADGHKKREEMLEMVDGIISNTLRAKSLVKQILAFSRYPSASPKSALCLNVVLTQSIALLRHEIPYNISIIQNIDNTCSMIMADEEQISQVIINIIKNAAESMEDNGGTLTITLREDDFKESCSNTGAYINGRYVCLSIKDTGHGIEKENLSRIFDPYFSTKSKFKSSGLGLSLVHGIVKSYKGEISVKSKAGGGSEFNLFFPCHKQVYETENSSKREIVGGSETILIVDDQPYITKLLTAMLQKVGYKVLSFNEPKAALDFLRKSPHIVDIFITDMTMPLITGDIAAKEAMSIRPDLPILILTGYSDKLSESEAVEMGIKGYLMKPITLADLADAVRRALDADKK